MTAGSAGWVSQALATVLALALVLALAWLVLRTLRRLQPGLGGGVGAVPQVLYSAGLGPRERLVLVRHRGCEYLLGVAAGGVAVIDRWEDAAAPPGPRSGAVPTTPSPVGAAPGLPVHEPAGPA